MQMPKEQNWPELHGKHTPPGEPHAVDSKPWRHSPTASQQPVLQVIASHFSGAGVPQEVAANITLSAIAERSTR